MKYAYPAVFTKEESGLYDVFFPDLECCYTSGNDLPDAIFMAEDALAITLYRYEKEGKPIPAPSSQSDIKTEGTSFTNIIMCDTLEYQKRNSKKAVKKTLSIPEWMNEAAIAANLNFSQLLQDAIREKLSLT